MSNKKIKIFICYPHKGAKKFLDELLSVLKARSHEISHIAYFSDNNIKPGDLTHDVIQEKIIDSNISIVFISQKTFESDYIIKTELPLIKEVFDYGDIKRICPLRIDDYQIFDGGNFEWLNKIQFVNQDKPLRDIGEKERFNIYYELVKLIVNVSS